MTFFAINWSQGFDDAWNDIATFLPKAAAFLLILIVGYFVARIIGRACRKVLQRVGFDEAVERGPVEQALAKSPMRASELAAKFVYFGALLIVLQMAFDVFGDNGVSDLIHAVIGYVPRVFAAIVIVVVAAMIAGFVRDLVTASLGGLSYGRLLGTISAGAIVVIGSFAALSQLQIAPAIVNATFYALLAVIAGSAIVAVGGGGIQPMRQRWENALNRYDAEKPRLRQQLEANRAAQAGQPGAIEAQGSLDLERSRERTPDTMQP
jgi:mechanosensitive ion channel-like protein